MPESSALIYTIGHSTRSLDDLVRLLKAHGVTALADVRSIPKSRRHPHFSREALSVSLPDAGIVYRHFPGLGGRRRPRKDSRNTAWRVEGFRGYADYMETPEFERALEDLIHWSMPAMDDRHDRQARVTGIADGARHGARDGARHASQAGAMATAIMCAEAVWWRCHRQLIADALVARGIAVRHISSETSAPAHTLTEFARLNDRRVSYPGLVG